MTQNLQDPIRNAFLVDLSSFQIHNKGELKKNCHYISHVYNHLV